jgi:hypothetical protein
MKKIIGFAVLLLLAGGIVFAMMQNTEQTSARMGVDGWKQQIAVAVKVIPCSIDRDTKLGGAQLLVYNPYSKNMDFFGAEIFKVEWFQNEQPIGVTYKVDDCICGSPVQVVVTDLRNYRSYRAEGIVPLCGLSTKSK